MLVLTGEGNKKDQSLFSASVWCLRKCFLKFCIGIQNTPHPYFRSTSPAGGEVIMLLHCVRNDHCAFNVQWQAPKNPLLSATHRPKIVIIRLARGDDNAIAHNDAPGKNTRRSRIDSTRPIDI